MSWTRFVRRKRLDDELREEIEAHLAHEVDRNLQAGMTPEAARSAALRKFGNATSVKETVHEMNSIGLLDELWQDLKHGVRLLRFHPTFAAVATLSLALGMGANGAIFRLLDAVRLRSLPVERPQELAEIQIAPPRSRTGRFTGRRPELTYAQWERIRDRQHSFSGVAAWGTERFNLARGGEARFAEGLWVSGSFFEVVGVSARSGRVFTPEDDRPGCTEPGVVVSDAFWQRELGGDPSAVGRRVSLEGQSFEIVGITPSEFFGVEVGKRFDVALPLCAQSLLHPEEANLENPSAWWLAAIGRLDSGVSLERATADLRSLSPGLFEETLPSSYTPEDRRDYLAFRLRALPAASGVSELRTEYETPLWLLLGASGLVLLIACANLASLMLARASARTREISVRLAIGASRGRLVRQLLAEGLVLAALGALGAWFVSRGAARLLVSFLDTAQDPISLSLETDFPSLFFLASLAVLSCLLMGLLPALRETRLPPVAAIRSGGRGATESREKHTARRVLVVAQVALSLVLLSGAVQFARSLGNLLTLDSGFQEEGLLIAAVNLERLGYPAHERKEVFERMLDRLRAIPGVQAAASAFIVPLGGFGWNDNVLPERSGDEGKFLANFNEVTDGYFQTMRTPLLAGRDFDDRDRPGSPLVAIVDESFAERLVGPGINPLGARFQTESVPGRAGTVYEVVGLVKNAKYESLQSDFTPTVFRDARQRTEAMTGTHYLLRSRIPAAAIFPAIEHALVEVEPQAALLFQVFQERTRESLQRERLMATLSGFFALLAALLAAIGLYGTLSYAVSRRRNEFGIRLALGANRRAVMAMVFQEAAVLLTTGLALGVVGSLLLVRAAQSLLFGMEASDPRTLCIALLALASIGLVSSLLPARRAASLEPRTVLGEE